MKQLRASTLNAAWKSICPECVRSENTITPTSDEFSEAIMLAHKIGGEGFIDIQIEDLGDILIDEPMNDEELINIVTETTNRENIKDINEENQNTDNIEFHDLTASAIREGIKFVNAAKQYFLMHDPNMERALKFQRDLQNYCSLNYIFK